MIGRTLSRIGSSGVSRSTSAQYSYSFFENRYLALGKVGTQRPFSSLVFQPTWSPCRCVHMTKSMSYGPSRAVFSALIQLWMLFLLHLGRSGKFLSLPMHASTRMLWCGVFTT